MPRPDRPAVCCFTVKFHAVSQMIWADLSSAELGWARLSWSGLTGLGPLFAILATTSWKQHRTCNPPLGTGLNIFRSPPTSWYKTDPRNRAYLVGKVEECIKAVDQVINFKKSAQTQAAQSSAVQSSAEQSRAAQSSAVQSRSEQNKAEKSRIIDMMHSSTLPTR